MKIHDIWPLLEADQTISGGYVQRLISSRSSLDLYLAIERPTSRRMFVFVADKKTLSNKRVLSNSKGLEIKTLNSSAYGPNNIAHQVILTDASYDDIFSTLLQDVCD